MSAVTVSTACEINCILSPTIVSLAPTTGTLLDSIYQALPSNDQQLFKKESEYVDLDFSFAEFVFEVRFPIEDKLRPKPVLSRFQFMLEDDDEEDTEISANGWALSGSETALPIEDKLRPKPVLSRFQFMLEDGDDESSEISANGWALSGSETAFPTAEPPLPTPESPKHRKEKKPPSLKVL